MGWSFDLHFGNERGERETGRSHERDTQTQTSAPRDEEARPRGLDTRDSTGERREEAAVRGFGSGVGSTTTREARGVSGRGVQLMMYIYR